MTTRLFRSGLAAALATTMCAAGVALAMERRDVRPVQRGQMLATKVTLTMPSAPMFVGSYARVPVRINATDLAFDDLDFMLPNGPAAGMVSLSRDKFFDPQQPTVMLGAGYRPGTYPLEVRYKPTGAVVGQGQFTIGPVWREEDGPPLWFSGTPDGFATGAARGLGQIGTVQNVAIHPAPAKWRVALIFVDTMSQRYPGGTEMDNQKTRWRNEAVDGVTSGDVTRSAAHFYREASYGKTDITAQTFGPVQLPGNYDMFFKEVNLGDGRKWIVPRDGTPQTIITLADPLIDYRDFDAVVFISQSVPESGSTDKFTSSAWPCATSGTFVTADGQRTLGFISMPYEWGLSDSRLAYSTLAHELGHTLGLSDMYVPDVPTGCTSNGGTCRNLGGWDLMDSQVNLPHFSLPHRLMLGWLPREWVKPIHISTAGPVTVKLQPIEIATRPPAGQRAGVELRLADGFNYYLEYRVQQGGHIGDGMLRSAVVGTDVESQPDALNGRPRILLFSKDLYGNFTGYKEPVHAEIRVTPDAAITMRLDLNILELDPAFAKVTINYQQDLKPDPAIQPWPVSLTNLWQSPDIEVRNARSDRFLNLPWENNPNTVVAKVHNEGTRDAPGVKVEFFVKKLALGDGEAATSLGTDQKDIPAGGQAEFSVPWTPADLGPSYIEARISRYQVPGTDIAEVTEGNNRARSNYVLIMSRFASPPSREVTEVEVTNPFDRATWVQIVPGQSSPLYRTYVEHTSVNLAPRQTRKVQVMFEYIGDEYMERSGVAAATAAKLRHAPNQVSLLGLVWNTRSARADTPLLMGGAQFMVAAGRATRFKSFQATGQGLAGQVVLAGTDQPAPNSHVILTLQQGNRRWNQRVTFTGGAFQWRSKEPWDTARAYYLPPTGFADATSENVRRP